MFFEGKSEDLEMKKQPSADTEKMQDAVGQ